MVQNETHDPALTSWTDSANAHPDFPIQNLPFGVVRRRGSEGAFHGSVAIGDYANGGRGQLWFTSPTRFEYCFANQTPAAMSAYCAVLDKQ